MCSARSRESNARMGNPNKDAILKDLLELPRCCCCYLYAQVGRRGRVRDDDGLPPFWHYRKRNKRRRKIWPTYDRITFDPELNLNISRMSPSSGWEEKKKNDTIFPLKKNYPGRLEKEKKVERPAGNIYL